ncbi:hypothetical protein ACO0QE_001646 [Hanseniaspora vineae]
MEDTVVTSTVTYVNYNHYQNMVYNLCNRVLNITIKNNNVDLTSVTNDSIALNNRLTIKDILVKLAQFPVLRYIINYIKKSHQNDPYRTLVEILLIGVGVLYINMKKNTMNNVKSSGNDGLLKLSKKEQDQLLKEWQPDALVDELDDSYGKWKLKAQVTLLSCTNEGNTSERNTSERNTSERNTGERNTGEAGVSEVKNNGVNDNPIDGANTSKKINGMDIRSAGVACVQRDVEYQGQVINNVYNAANLNFLDLQNSPQLVSKIKTTLKNYGVGACGPAGFYGNVDVHYNLEYDLAHFFQTENAVLYGQDFCVAASVLSTFNKRGDIIVADNGCCVSIQNALQLSRASIYHYQHNDMQSLEKILAKIDKEEKFEPEIHRKFIVTEGIFQNNGDLCPLPELITLKHKYNFRLFIDETLSLGSLGTHGRGIVEHYGYPNRSNEIVDITVGSMATAFGSSGGIVLGDNVMSFFQRIGSNAYCFSASLPPYCCVAVSESMRILEKDPSSVTKLHENTGKLYTTLHKKLTQSNCNYVLTSSPDSPMLIIKMNQTLRSKLFNSSMQSIYASLNNQKNNLHVTNTQIKEFNNEEMYLQKIVETLLLEYKVLIALTPHSLQHETLPLLPSLTVTTTAAFTEKEIEYIAESIGEVLVKFS